MVQDRIYNYFERNPKLRVLFIFDRMSMIESELQDASWQDGFHYVVFDGTWFGTKYAIENQWKDEKVVLLFKEEYKPVNEQKRLEFPLLDLLMANMEYKEDDYASFIQQYNLPEKFSPFIKKHIGELQTNRIRTLMQNYLTPQAFSEDVFFRAMVSDYLGQKKVLDWEDIIVRLIVLGLESEGKKRNDFFTRINKNIDVNKALQDKMSSIFGYGYNPNTEVKVREIAESLKYNSFTQLLEQSPSDLYRKYKVTDRLKLEQMNRIIDRAAHDRTLSAPFNQAIAKLGEEIKEQEIIRIYGIDANYFYVTEDLCWPIIATAVKERLQADPMEVSEKMRDLSLKLPESSAIQEVLSFAQNLALYYDKIRGLGTLKLNTPEQYVQKYLNEFYLVDYFYRQALEAYHTVMNNTNPIEQTLNEVKRQLDQDYATVTNIFNLEWLTCVKEKGDAFNELTLKRQQDFYKDNIDPSVKQVVIISDALRFEVAKELMQELSKEKHMASLTPCLAMLPTETKFCKQSILPHHTLTLQGAEMATDGVVLNTLDLRTAQLKKYRQDAVCIAYKDVMDGDVLSKREIFKNSLVYIYHDTIDEASHNQNPFDVISACRRAIEQLTALIRRIHATWNVNNVLLTADHGFLYNDMVFTDKDKHSIKEETLEKKTRYYLTSSDAPIEGVMKFPIEKVSGIITSSPVYVAVPEGTNRLAAPGGYNFAHGGATLQELIVPVIHSVLKRQDKTDKVNVVLLSNKLNMVNSRVKFTLIQSEAVSMTLMERKVICCVFDGNNPITEEVAVTLNSPDAENPANRMFNVTLNLKKNTSSSLLQLRVWDVDAPLNPLIKETVKNNTFIEQDF